MRVTIRCEADGTRRAAGVWRRTVPKGWRVVEPFDKEGNPNFVRIGDKLFCTRCEKFDSHGVVPNVPVDSCYKVIRRIHRKK